MKIVLTIPEEWSPELALALRALLQQAVNHGCPIVVSIRGDATAEEISALQARIRALVQESGLAA
jgi:hypothetical protein